MNLLKKDKYYHSFLKNIQSTTNSFTFDELLDYYIFCSQGAKFPAHRFLTPDGINKGKLEEAKASFIKDRKSDLSEAEVTEVQKLLVEDLDVILLFLDLWGEETTWLDKPDLLRTAKVNYANLIRLQK